MSSDRPAAALEVFAHLRQAEETRFWGEIVIQYRDGIPVLVRRNETILIGKSGRTDHAGHENIRP